MTRPKIRSRARRIGMKLVSWPWGTIIIAGATTVAAAATVVYTIYASKQWLVMRDQSGVMQKQLTEMQAEQRPWVSLLMNSGIERVFIDRANGQLAVTLRFSLTNTGRDPATDVYVSADMSIGEFPYPSMAAWQNSVCHQLHGNPLGLTLFPGAQPTYDITIEHVVPGLAKGLNTTPNTIVNPIFAACVTYRDVVSGDWHYTPVGFMVYTLSPQTGKPCCAIFLRAPPAEGTEGDEADPQLLTNRQHLRFGLTPPERVLALDRGDRLNRMRATNGRGTRLGQAEVFDLALPNEVLHRASNILDRDVGIDPVQKRSIAAIRRRFSEPSAACRMRSGRLLRPPEPLGLRSNPNLVAMTTSLRNGSSASPTSSSLVNGP